jgi:hypothetical protein
MALLGAVASTLRRLEVYHHHNWRQYVISWGNMYNDKVRIALVCHGSLTGVSIYRVGDFGPPDRHLISQDKIRLRKTGRDSQVPNPNSVTALAATPHDATSRTLLRAWRRCGEEQRCLVLPCLIDHAKGDADWWNTGCHGLL